MNDTGDMGNTSDTEAAIQAIREAFGRNAYPGDAFLQGSFEGCEPYDEVGAFVGKGDWQALDAEFLNAHYAVLSFFSEAGLRFFLPAFLVADLRDELGVDPSFHVTHGFSDWTMEERVGDRLFVRTHGRTALLNPRRYGAATSYDYARYRLSVFTREEARAIVAYLRCKRAAASNDFERRQIDGALDAFWLERADAAPTAADLEQHLAEQSEFFEALRRRSATTTTNDAADARG